MNLSRLEYLKNNEQATRNGDLQGMKNMRSKKKQDGLSILPRTSALFEAEPVIQHGDETGHSLNGFAGIKQTMD